MLEKKFTSLENQHKELASEHQQLSEGSSHKVKKCAAKNSFAAKNFFVKIGPVRDV